MEIMRHPNVAHAFLVVSDIYRIRVIYVYIYIYMCVCVCVYNLCSIYHVLYCHIIHRAMELESYFF